MIQALSEPEAHPASADEALQFTREKTPELLDLMGELEASLKPYFEKASSSETDENLPVLAQEELDELYEAIREFAGMYDQNGLNRLLNQTKGYAIPDGEKERFETIRKCVRDSDWDALRQIQTGQA